MFRTNRLTKGEIRLIYARHPSCQGTVWNNLTELGKLRNKNEEVTTDK